MSMRRLRRVPPLIAFVLAALMASGCGNAPPVAKPALVRKVPATTPFEQQEQDLARQRLKQGHLAEAATHWEVLALLRPQEPFYEEQLARTRKQIDSALAEELPGARQALKRGAWEEAMQRYLAVLALQPTHAEAAEALQGIERERNRRDYLGRYSRVTLASRGPRGISQRDAEAANNPATQSASRNDLEHATLLAGQGEYDDAIALLRQGLQERPTDNATRALLADVYFQQAESLRDKDRTAARTALGKCLQLNPRHAQARQRLAAMAPPQARPSSARQAP
jgi:hypothetical protein